MAALPRGVAGLCGVGWRGCRQRVAPVWGWGGCGGAGWARHTRDSHSQGKCWGGWATGWHPPPPRRGGGRPAPRGACRQGGHPTVGAAPPTTGSSRRHGYGGLGEAPGHDGACLGPSLHPCSPAAPGTAPAAKHREMLLSQPGLCQGTPALRRVSPQTVQAPLDSPSPSTRSGSASLSITSPPSPGAAPKKPRRRCLPGCTSILQTVCVCVPATPAACCLCFPGQSRCLGLWMWLAQAGGAGGAGCVPPAGSGG